MPLIWPRFSINRRRFVHLLLTLVTILSIITALFPPRQISHAAAGLTIEPLTWNIVGLDSNNVNVGPANFPVGARVCNTGTTEVNNVSSAFAWDSADPYLNLRDGSASEYTGATAHPELASGECIDFYYEVAVTRSSAAYEHSRRYHISADSDETAPISTLTPRALYVEHLVSQNRNAVTDIKLDGVSVPNGGTMHLDVGATYNIQLVGSTSTNGYSQLESFINLPNRIFRINSVTSTYDVTTLPAPHDYLYADACGWENDPLSPNYRSCVESDGKTGGDVTTTYNVTIISGAGSTSSMNTLLYDFSGSSFHYNSDFSSSARFVAISSPVSFSKVFSPASTAPGGTATLQYTINNLSANPITSLGFIDLLPTGPAGSTPPPGSEMLIAGLPNAQLVACGSEAVFTAGAGTGTVSVDDVSLPAGASCTFSVDVTVPVEGAYNSTSQPLTIGGVSTGITASAVLTAAAASAGSGLSSCTTRSLAQWTMGTGAAVSAPPLASFRAGDVSSALASFHSSVGGHVIDNSTGNPANSWAGYGWEKSGTPDIEASTYFMIAVDTSNYSTAAISLDASANTNWGPNGNNLFVYSSTTGNAGSFEQIGSTVALQKVTWPASPYTFNAPAAGAETTYFRISAVGANNTGSSTSLMLDNITVTGCGDPVQPGVAAAFTSPQIAAGGASTLRLTFTNQNSEALTGAAFSELLPAGLTIVGAASNCAGSVFAPLGEEPLLEFSGATIPAGGSCIVDVNVTGDDLGRQTFVLSRLTTVEMGSHTAPDGLASASLDVLAPPGFSKQFSPDIMYAGQNSLLTFTLSNPNHIALNGLSFSDSLPAGMVIADDPAAGTTCAGAAFSPAAGAASLSFSTSSLAENETCTAWVSVTADAVSLYTNTASALTAATAGLASQPAAAPLAVIEHFPGIKLSLQVSTGDDGPWTSFLSTQPGSDVYYRLLVENTGDVDLSNVSVVSNDLSLAGCPLSEPFALTTADPIASCSIGPMSAVEGDQIVSAAVSGTYSGSLLTGTAAAEVAAFNAVDGPALQVLTLIADSPNGPWTSMLSGITPGANLYFKYILSNTGNVPLSGVSLHSTLNDAVSCEIPNPLPVGAAAACITGPLAAQSGSHANTATASSTTPDVTFLNTQAEYMAGAFSLGGTTWLDISGEGTLDPAELPLEGILLRLRLDNGDGLLGEGDLFLSFGHSGPDGSYTFDNLSPGDYFVEADNSFNSFNMASGGANPRLVTITEDGSSGNNFGYQADEELQPSELAVSITNDTDDINAGGFTTYRVTVVNNGPAEAPGWLLTITPTADLTFSNVSCMTGCTTPPSAASLPDGVVMPALGVGEYFEIMVTADISDAASGTAGVSAAVSTLLQQLDPVPGNNFNEDIDDVIPSPDPETDLVISVGNGLDSLAPGQVSTYTIQVVNQGDSTVTGAVLQLTTITRLTITGIACGPSSECASAPGAGDLSAGFALPALPPGGVYEIRVTTEAGAAGGNAECAASISPPSGTTDVDTFNNTSGDSDSIEAEQQGPLKSHRVYLPLMMNRAMYSLTVSWEQTLGYEDLPLLQAQNDYDYNDWVVNIAGTLKYTEENPEGDLQEIRMVLTPQAHGGKHDHEFQINLPASMLDSSGAAQVTLYDQSRRVLNTRTQAFSQGENLSLVVFPRTSGVFPEMMSNTLESKARVAPLQTAVVVITFDQPFQFILDQQAIANAHGAGLFFDPALRVINTQDQVHTNDMRLLSVPSVQWKWPEEGQRIDTVYPNVRYRDGELPSFAFPYQWWIGANQCAIDGRPCPISSENSSK